MKQLSEQQIVENWNKLMKLIEDTFEGDRLRKLKQCILTSKIECQ